jgi:hypothetical protein
VEQVSERDDFGDASCGVAIDDASVLGFVPVDLVDLFGAGPPGVERRWVTALAE